MKNQNTILIVILLAFYFFYFCLSTGLNSSNDGGHIGLAKAIFYDHDVIVEKYVDKYIFSPDYAIKDGKIYSDRLPGTALLILPMFACANLLLYLGIESISCVEHDIVVASLLPPLIGTLSILLLFLFYIKAFKIDFKIALLSVILYGLCTLSMLESSHLYSHAPSLFFVSLSVFIIILNKFKDWKNKLYICAVLIGIATLIELQNILFIVPIFIYTIVRQNIIKNIKIWLPTLMKLSLILAVFFGNLASI